MCWAGKTINIEHNQHNHDCLFKQGLFYKKTASFKIEEKKLEELRQITVEIHLKNFIYELKGYIAMIFLH